MKNNVIANVIAIALIILGLAIIRSFVDVFFLQPLKAEEYAMQMQQAYASDGLTASDVPVNAGQGYYWSTSSNFYFRSDKDHCMSYMIEHVGESEPADYTIEDQKFKDYVVHEIDFLDENGTVSTSDMVQYSQYDNTTSTEYCSDDFDFYPFDGVSHISVSTASGDEVVCDVGDFFYTRDNSRGLDYRTYAVTCYFPTIYQP